MGMNSFWIQESLLIRLTTDLPLIVAWNASGNLDKMRLFVNESYGSTKVGLRDELAHS